MSALLTVGAIIAGVIAVLCLALIGFAVWATQPTTVRGDALARLERLDRLDGAREDQS